MDSYSGWLAILIGVFILVVIVRGKGPAVIAALQ